MPKVPLWLHLLSLSFGGIWLVAWLGLELPVWMLTTLAAVLIGVYWVIMVRSPYGRQIEDAAWAEAFRQQLEKTDAETQRKQQQSIAAFCERDFADTQEVGDWTTGCPYCQYIFNNPKELRALLATAEPCGGFSQVTCSKCSMKFGVSVSDDD